MNMKLLLTAFWILVLAILSHLQLDAQGSWIRNEVKIESAVEQYDLSGEGAVVVMIDRGIDYRHPDFVDAMGKTRIAYIYDMTNSAGVGDRDHMG
ncbi:MAG: minor extracellular serine protease Vpr [Saprospiraceae bacterium]|jgi:minor extracellular serine protease Vpr